jgi:hypothetical protein
MKTLLALGTILFSSISSFSQISVSSVYESGEINVDIQISYPANMITADSVRLEACFQEYDALENPKVFIKEKTVKGLPKTIRRNNYFDIKSKPKHQIFRVAVFQKGKAVVYSNEVAVDYHPYKYREDTLAKVNNIKATYKIIDGKNFVTLTWNAVPNAFGYKILEKDPYSQENRYVANQMPDGNMPETTETTFTFETDRKGTMQFGIVAVNSPYDSSVSDLPFDKIGSTILVTE